MTRLALLIALAIASWALLYAALTHPVWALAIIAVCLLANKRFGAWLDTIHVEREG